jgi:ammonia channel protein AmtB
MRLTVKHATQGNSGVYKVLGTLVLFVTWLSFNASAASDWTRMHVGALAASNTAIAGSFSCFTVMAWKTLYNRFEVNLSHSTDGLLAGCVSITAGATHTCMCIRMHVGIFSLTLSGFCRDSGFMLELDL